MPFSIGSLPKPTKISVSDDYSLISWGVTSGFYGDDFISFFIEVTGVNGERIVSNYTSNKSIRIPNLPQGENYTVSVRTVVNGGSCRSDPARRPFVIPSASSREYIIIMKYTVNYNRYFISIQKSYRVRVQLFS